MADERSEDPGALLARVADAARVLIYDAGCYHYTEPGEGTGYKILSDEPIVTVAGSTAVSALIDRLHVSRVTDVACMCMGTASMEFLDASGERLTVASLHHGTGLRWSGWSGDAQLADGPGLWALLSELGYDGPQEEAERAESRRARAAAIWDAWSAAAPECVRPLLSDTMANEPSELRDATVRVEAIVAESYPEPVERCRVALAWFGAGTGLCTGYPLHEDIPGDIVAKLPIGILAEALEGEPPAGPVWAGALRHVAGWRTRSKGELLQLPSAVWDTLLEIAQQGNDADKLERIERKRSEYRKEW